MADPLARLLFTPTPEQKQVMELRRQVGRAEDRAVQLRSEAQGHQRTAERRAERTAELEAALLDKQTEAGGFRLAAFELLDSATFEAIDIRYERTRREDEAAQAKQRLAEGMLP